MKKLLIIGAGGHGKAVADAALESKRWNDICFLDDSVIGECISYKIIGSVDQLPEFVTSFSGVIVAVGDNKKRIQLLSRAKEIGFVLATIIHPQAFVSSHANIEEGTVVFAYAAINASSKISFGCIINTGAVVEHDCILSCGIHLSPNASLAGGVKVGRYSWIGIGSSVIEKIKLGKNTIVGAGSVVINDIPDDVIVVGNPAKVIKKNEQ